ncbi:MAG: DNA-3-methyladenine glycosylase I [Ignavibacteria bacterium]|nr:DNA-3-methyladenine glycosylase I [Ignavibacteria bacterium]
MDAPLSYCDYVLNGSGSDHALHKAYHDELYGFPIHDDNELFGRLLLEIFQAGLSWTIILRKEQHFREAFDNYSISKIAGYSDDDVQRLLANPGIVRNRLKIFATINNAGEVLRLQSEFGSLKNWLDTRGCKSKEDWVKLFKKHFKFTGGEIVNEFLMSSGYLPGAHTQLCPVYHKIVTLNPAWKIKK